MKRMPYQGWLAFGFSWVAAGCGSPVDAPSAYDTAQYLCDDAHAAAWNAEVASCVAARASGASCAGTMSFRGTVDHQPIVVSARPTSAAFDFEVDSEGQAVRNLRMRGTTPYSEVALAYQFYADGRTDTPKTLTSNLNFEARGGNYLVGTIPTSLSITVDTPDEFEFASSAKLTRGGTFEGCFHVFLTP